MLHPPHSQELSEKHLLPEALNLGRVNITKDGGFQTLSLKSQKAFLRRTNLVILEQGDVLYTSARQI